MVVDLYIDLDVFLMFFFSLTVTFAFFITPERAEKAHAMDDVTTLVQLVCWFSCFVLIRGLTVCTRSSG